MVRDRSGPITGCNHTGTRNSPGLSGQMITGLGRDFSTLPIICRVPVNPEKKNLNCGVQNPAGSTASQRVFAFCTSSHVGIMRMMDERA
jgi:hypothetical protein